MGKQDIKSAFNLCPIYPGDFDLLGIASPQGYWIQKVLPQGTAISCAIFEKVLYNLFNGLFLGMLIQKKFRPYLDDFWFWGHLALMIV